MGEDSKLRITRRPRLLSKFSYLSIELTLTASPDRLFPVELSAITLAKLLEQLAPDTVAGNSAASSVVDLRGRPRESFNSPPRSIIDEKQRREELFAVSGHFVSPDSTSDEHTVIGEQDLFGIELLTKFESFRGAQHIVHSCQRILHGFSADFAQHFSLQRLGFLIPVQFTECRLGVELYRSRFRGSMLSFAAGIEQRLYVELRANSCWLFYSDEYAPNTGLPDLLAPSNKMVSYISLLLETHLGFHKILSRIRELSEHPEKGIEIEESILREGNGR